MSYVDGFVLSVPKTKVEKYRKIARAAGKLWKEHGALSYMECMADDTDAKGMVSFPKLANAKKNEVVMFSFITYKSRKHRDQVNKKVMADKRIHEMCKPDEMPFDCSRMAYGGFKAIVEF